MADDAIRRWDEADLADPLEKELADFSYIVSHDLSADVRHVSEFSRLLLRDLEGGLTERQQAYAQRVREAASRCQAKVEHLLVYSRVQQKTLAPTLHDPTRSMRAALLQLSQEVREAGAEVSIAPLPPVFADPDLLSAAFKHLLDNAIKFRREGVPVRIDIRPAPARNGWGLRMSDNGLGLPVEQRDKAFGMFQQLHPEGAYAGVGAGLALCRRIARRHGGEVRFVDQAAGACVELSLPLTREPA